MTSMNTRRTDVPVDLDDTSRCPQDETCADCGTTTTLAVVTAETQVGVYCLTLCAADRIRPRGSVNVVQAVNRVLEHCGHLGITADDMEAALRDDDNPVW